MSAFHTILHRGWGRSLGSIATLCALCVFTVAMAAPADAACVGGTRNGIVQAGEDCDDNNASNTDACTNTCEWASCGDGFTCVTNCELSAELSGPEECDDTGESVGCNSDCTLADCGDGKLNVTRGEQCDDGNPSNTDGCLTTCQEASCGDGFVQAGVEDCDDADASNSDGCLNTCEWATCGDSFQCTSGCVNPAPGQVNPNLSGTEACDDGGQSATCDTDCTVPTCGDGVHNADAGEECDDGVNDGGAGECRPGCIAPTCGDGIADPGEECDDGDVQNNDYCTTECKWAACGDGFECTDVSGGDACVNSPNLDGAEECDDANAIDTDSCLSTCEDAECGDGFTQAGVEGCDDGDDDNADECRNDCVAATCGDGIIQTETGEQCDEGPSHCAVGGVDGGEECNVDADCRGTCDGTTDNPGFPCTPATVADDCGSLSGCDVSLAYCDNLGNNDQEADACRSNCLQDNCGDGVIDTGENCDSGAQGTSGPCVITQAGGAPSSVAPLNCRLATCGDDHVCSDASCTSGPGAGPEGCDDGDNFSNDGCLSNCAVNTCGDNIRDCGPDGLCDNEDDEEACDQGVLNSDTIADRCRTDCTLAGCGDGVTDAPENCDDAGVSATCDEDCTFVVCNDGVLNPLAEDCEDGNTTPGDGCDANCQDESCGDGIVNDVDEECDPGAETVGCDSNCTLADCGDGDLNATRGETCDDGNTTSGDGCDTACQEEYCGDGTVNNAQNNVATEECDDGVNNDDTLPDACRTNCQEAGCGDGVTDTPENCDDAGESAGCDDDCTFVSCGDANVNEASGEECDDGVNLGGPDACRPGCFDPVCGDSVTDPGSGEQCDSPVASDCTADCCATGAVTSSYNTGLVGMDCQLSNLDGQCDPGSCLRAKNINKKIARMQRGLEKAILLAGDSRLRRAENVVRNIRNRSQSILNNLARLCPDDSDGDSEADVRLCLQDQLTSIVVIALETEENLALNNP